MASYCSFFNKYYWRQWRSIEGSAFTFTGGTTGLTFSGSGSTETLTGTLVVANGGTGKATFTAYSVICAGTTATGIFQNVSGVGTFRTRSY